MNEPVPGTKPHSGLHPLSLSRRDDWERGGGTPAEFYKMRHMRYIIIQCSVARRFFSPRVKKKSGGNPLWRTSTDRSPRVRTLGPRGLLSFSSRVPSSSPSVRSFPLGSRRVPAFFRVPDASERSRARFDNARDMIISGRTTTSSFFFVRKITRVHSRISHGFGSNSLVYV